MLVVRQSSPLRLAGTIYTCIRRRKFSQSTLVYNDKKPTPNSSFPFRTPQPRQSMNETPKQDFLKIITDLLSTKQPKFGRNVRVPSPSSSYDSDIFQPADLPVTERQSDPAVAQARPAPLPLPRGVLRRPGYF